ncbi:YgiW/YdeI family stress tolerance OB fold protein [Photobacterium damselae]|uniref:YgiW/YdeI family stress tolerance OB fold protein n=1 Tax=Photobacterium damselae TaxID=38293 RepID=UPI001F422A94|nr:NirD/YgiW/YdeI family stress tolerance protein [Photobacterium damselae]UKA03981.1 NirD/YgiW/YdeI family stress tolerance protein [Photobacterium damselae subsp. damselae]
MKKIILIATLFSTTAFANSQIINQQVQQGFSGPSQGISSAKEALNAGTFSDDTPVTLTGYIKISLGGEMYTFNDGSGDITIEIDNDDWYGLKVTPQDEVVIQGEIDKDFNGTSIDVNSIRLAK